MKDSDLDNPYLQARAEFYDSVGYPVKAAAQWRLAAFISFLLLLTRQLNISAMLRS